jgi:hypothetical protein
MISDSQSFVVCSAKDDAPIVALRHFVFNQLALQTLEANTITAALTAARSAVPPA